MSDFLDEEFPLGDGVADDTAWVECPHCGEENELAVDPGGGILQQYIEDCEVCCRPMQLTVTWDDEGVASAHAVSDDDVV
ncbi:MAG TPA: CPXCG motif-containing cysteine-rich protein [Longimicrobiales bacterium]|nr:CPXCG motif-containing cysteine-rich protein [Longimicrobiales bacterium]